MDPAAMKPWLDLLVSYGVPVLITAGVLILAWRYIPKAIDSSIEAQKSFPAAVTHLTTSIDTLADTVRDSGNELKQSVTKDMHELKEEIQKVVKAVTEK